VVQKPKKKDSWREKKKRTKHQKTIKTPTEMEKSLFLLGVVGTVDHRPTQIEGVRTVSGRRSWVGVRGARGGGWSAGKDEKTKVLEEGGESVGVGGEENSNLRPGRTEKPKQKGRRYEGREKMSLFFGKACEQTSRGEKGQKMGSSPESRRLNQNV